MRDGCAIAGTVSLCTGAALVYVPAGLIVLGALLLGLSLWGYHRAT